MMLGWLTLLVASAPGAASLVAKNVQTTGLYVAARTSEEALRRVQRVREGDALSRLQGQYAVGAGKAICVTGATSGIGLELGCELAELGYAVVLCGRDEASLAKAAEKASKSTAAGRIGTACFDLEDLEAVEAGAEAIVEACGENALGGVVLNAGQWPSVLSTTVDDLEAGLQTNHVAQALLVDRLPSEALDVVVTLSSLAHAGCADLEPVLTDPEWRSRDFEPTESYCAAKLMALLYAKSIATMYSTRAVAAHPGFVATDLFRSLDPTTVIQSAVPDPFGLLSDAFYRTQGLSTSVQRLVRSALDQTPDWLLTASPVKTPRAAARDVAAALLDTTLQTGDYVSDGLATDVAPLIADPADRARLESRLFDWTRATLLDRGFPLRIDDLTPGDEADAADSSSSSSDTARPPSDDD